MDDDSDSTPDRIEPSDDASRPFAALPDTTQRPHTTVYVYVHEATDPERTRPLPFTFEHDKEKRVFVLTWADGEVEVFRDNATRYLVVEPDSEPGELRPKLTYGRPTFLYLCREERERP
jgi:hypothetical protein